MSDDEYYDDGPGDDGDNGPVDLVPCNICGRRFRQDVVSKHTRACQKLQKRAAARRVFDSSKQRAVVTGDVVIPVAKLASKPEQAKKIENQIKPAKKSNWRQKSEEFRAIMRAGRVNADGEVAPAPAFTRDDLVECQYCGRKFSENASERHISFCEQQHQRKGMNADGAARERMNARIKYQPPKLKSRTNLNQDDDRLLRRPQQMRSGQDQQMTRQMTMNGGMGESNSAPVARGRRPPFDPRSYEDSQNGVGHIPLNITSNQNGADSGYSTMQYGGGGKPPAGNGKANRSRVSNPPSGIPKPSMMGGGNRDGNSNGNGSGIPNRNGVRSRTPSPGPRGRQQQAMQNGMYGSPQRSTTQFGLDGAAKRDVMTSKILARVNVKHRTNDDSDFDDHQDGHLDGTFSAPKQGPMRNGHGHGYGNGNGNSNGYANENGSGRNHGPAGMNGGAKMKPNGVENRPLPKFCHECGFTFPIVQAKFCCECGARRIVIGPSNSD